MKLFSGAICALKPYPAMKDSGVPWLGKVPEHWKVERLKSLVSNVVEQTFVRADSELYVALEHVEGWTGRLKPAGNDVHFESQVKRFHAGDVLFGKLRPYLAKVTRPSQDGVCVGEFFVLRPRASNVCTSYLEQLTRSKPVIDAIDSSTFGAKMPRADWHFVGGMCLTFPPNNEQSAIVRFLDHADRRIRRYIRAKQKLIKLLNEQKQAIIHRAVTRGLDPNVRLKPSGVEWLGDVPEHWGVERVKNLFRLRTEKSGMSHGMELLSIYTHIGVRPRKDLEQKGNRASSTDDYWIVHKDDIIVNKLLAWMGAVGVSAFEGVTSPAYDILKPIRQLFSEYYHHLFRNDIYLQQFKRRSRGIMDMRLRLYFDQFGQIPVLVPPVNEQESIISYYGEATAELVKVGDAAQHEIALLREYRTRLIADVVTGKLDVRQAAANLPDEALGIEDTDQADMLAEGDDDIDEEELTAVAEEA